MTLLKRYISAVTSYLPDSRREEIGRELSANVLDRIDHLEEQKGASLNDTEIAQVLKELGHPRIVAQGYLPTRQLVSEALFPLYTDVLRYVVTLVFALAIIESGVWFVLDGSLHLSGALMNFVIKTLVGFAIVTGVFYLLSNPAWSESAFKPWCRWEPEQLPSIRYSWQRIDTCGQMIEISLNVLLLILVNYSLWAPANILANMQLMPSEALLGWLGGINILIALAIVLGVWNLWFSVWSSPRLIVSGLLNLAFALIFWRLAQLPEIFVQLSPEVQHFSVDAVHVGTRIGFVVTGLWLMCEALQDFYRSYRLYKAVK